MAAAAGKVTFPGADGQMLAARLDMPAGPVRAFALFAHCFTCTKDVLAARRIAAALAAKGVAVLRFDFTGLGGSGGEFANTNFSSNIADLVAAADFLRSAHRAPALLIGHSLGGTAVLMAAAHIPEATGVVTIGAPADVGHVLHQFGSSLAEIRDNGEAHVTLAGRSFRIARSFVEDTGRHDVEAAVRDLGKALLVLHAPRDDVVGIDNATKIFVAAKHPKSFVSLDDADHLVTDPAIGGYVAEVVAAWASKYLPAEVTTAPEGQPVRDGVVVRETGGGKFQNEVIAGSHRLLADEPSSVGGLDTGPSPYDYLAAALGACTSMTLRMYADRKGLTVGPISVDVRHGKVPAEHCADCGAVAEGRTGRIDRFERVLSIEGVGDPELRAKLLEIADKCPVHRTLEAASAIVTKFTDQ